MTVDNLSSALGNPGKFQMILCIMILCNPLFLSWNHLGMAFIGAKTKHHCQVGNNKTQITQLVPMVKKGGTSEWDGCHLFSGYNTTNKVPCANEWTYYLKGRENTVIAQWDLVCDDAYKANLATTIYFCGVLLGGLVLGPLADTFGRRPVLLFTLYSPCIIGLLVFLFQNYVAFVILRFFLGFVLQGLQITEFIICMEIFALKYRTIVGTMFSVMWAVGVMSLALIAYVIQDWQYIQLFTTITTVLQIGLIWFLPESFRWLFVKQRFEKAENVVKRIASFNNIPFPEDVFNKVKEENKETLGSKPDKKYTIIDMFRLSGLRKRSVIMAWLWFSTSIGYYGISLNISSLAGNKYINFFIGGVLELIAYIMIFFILSRFGRRKPLAFYLMIGSVTVISAGVLSERADNDGLRTLMTALAIIGKFGFAGSFCILFIYTSELFPTVIRNVSSGACASCARLGGVVAPQILLLGRTARSIPFIMFGCFAFVASLISLFLPETLNTNLTDTIDEDGRLDEKSFGDNLNVVCTADIQPNENEETPAEH